MERARPTVFGHGDRRLLGFYHPPVDERAVSLGVVLCNPLGHESMSAHRTYRHLAERLAERGISALRFDYSGTGDSSGEPSDPRRVEAWVGDVRAAMRHLQALSGVRQLALFGVRFGASLAAVAARGEADVEALVLWAPIVSGRAHVRELRAFRMLKNPKAKRVDGGEEIGGYFFSRETLADMGTVDLLAEGAPAPPRLLLIPRGEAPTDEESRLAARWASEGTEVLVAGESRYAAMMRDDPYESVVPSQLLDSIGAWLEASPASALRPPAGPPSVRTTFAVPGGAGEPSLSESALVFGEGQRLFGVICEPAGPAATPTPPHRGVAICLLNVGADSHVGPHRMNVELARDLSRLGYLTFRFDVAGLGESLAAPGQLENRLYSLDSVSDVSAAMTELAKARGVERFVLVGLCAGAFLAYHGAVRDPRVRGMVLLNMYAFEWKEGDPVAPTFRKTYHSSRHYVRGLRDGAVWQRVLKGQVDLRGIAGVVLERYVDQLAASARSLAGRLLGGGQTRVERELHALCSRGVKSLMVFSAMDGGLDMIARYLGSGARRMRRRKEFALEVIDGVDHTFASLDSQRRVRLTVLRYMAGNFP